jgi:Type I 3-dehydroquinase
MPQHTAHSAACQPVRQRLHPARAAGARGLAGGGEVQGKTKVIVSYHDFEETPDDETLRNLVDAMFGCGGDIAKVAATATDISDSARMLQLLENQQGVPQMLLLSPNHRVYVLPEVGKVSDFAARRPSAS